MKYNLSAQFLRVRSPETTFSSAWEALCHELLMEELNDKSLIRLKAPDRGIDIWDRSRASAYQCKSTEAGALGSIPSAESIESIRSAVISRSIFGWDEYVFATNASYSGNAVAAILDDAKNLGLDPKNVIFRGPHYWSSLVEKYMDKVSGYFDYRLTVSEDEVRQAFVKARYFDSFIEGALKNIKENRIDISVSSNRVPIVINMPFSDLLDIENLLDVVCELFGVNFDSVDYDDIGTSARVSASLKIDGDNQPFSKPIGEALSGRDPNIELCLKIIWSKNKKDSHNIQLSRVQSYLSAIDDVDRREINVASETIKRFEDGLQNDIWNSVVKLGQNGS